MSISTTVATRDEGPTAMIEQYRADFATVLPAHIKADTWVRLAVGVFRRDAKLRAAAQNNPAALMTALLTAARLGHEPGTEAYYLTPRGVKGPDGKWRDEILGIEGYQGIVERIYRAGAVSAVKVEAVYSNDVFHYSPGTDDRPTHQVTDWFGDRGKLVGAYAFAVMKDGATSKVVIVGPNQIERAKKASSTAGKSFSPWASDEEAMVLKTAARQLRKWVPTSAEYREEMAKGQAAAVTVADKAGALPPPMGQEIDDPEPDVDEHGVIIAEIVDEPQGWAS